MGHPPEWLDDAEFEAWGERRRLVLADLRGQLACEGLTERKKRGLVEAIELWEADLRAWAKAREGRYNDRFRGRAAVVQGAFR
jgi:hypothetical protein